MAVAGGTSPCLALTYDPDLNIIIIGHGENRLIRAQVDMLDEDGNPVLITKGKNAGKVRQVMVPTGACELDLNVAVDKLLKGERVWVRAMDRGPLAEKMDVETCPNVFVKSRLKG